MANNAFRNNADYWLASPTTADNQKPAWVPFVQLSGATGTALGTATNPVQVVQAQNTYQLANNITITATTGAAAVNNVFGGDYVWDATFTGTSLQLQSLGSDGATYRTMATLNASGTYAGEIHIGANATVRVYNPNGTSDTGVYSSLT